MSQVPEGMHIFPKSKKSWEQTNFLVIVNVQSLEQELTEPLGKPVRKLRHKFGMFAIADLCAEITDAFEKEYKDEKWEDRDYIDTVDEFVNDKLRRYEG